MPQTTNPPKSMGRILMYSCFFVFLLSWIRNDFNSAVTYGLFYFLPLYLALKYITKPGS
jgi:hypothetical protein